MHRVPVPTSRGCLQGDEAVDVKGFKLHSLYQVRHKLRKVSHPCRSVETRTEKSANQREGEGVVRMREGIDYGNKTELRVRERYETKRETQKKNEPKLYFSASSLPKRSPQPAEHNLDLVI